MSSSRGWFKNVRGSVRVWLSVALAALVLVPVCLWASAPAWWAEKGVLTPTATPDDYAAANQGQVKHIAKQAYEEMKAKLPGGAGATLDGIWATPATSTDDFRAINLGQLKNVAEPFYARLQELNYTGQPLTSGQTRPWTSAGADDYALANIGQVKNVFSFSPNSLEEVYFCTIISGNHQVGVDGAELPIPLAVKFSRSDGSLVSGLSVRFSIEQGAGLLRLASGGTQSPELNTETSLLGEAYVLLKLVSPSTPVVKINVHGDGGQPTVFTVYSKQLVVSQPGSGDIPLQAGSDSVAPGGAPTARPDFWNGLPVFSPPGAVRSLQVSPDHIYEGRIVTLPWGEVQHTIGYAYNLTSKWGYPTVRWTAPLSGAASYMIERKTNFGDWVSIAETSDLFHVDSTGLLAGVLYEYRVIAVQGGIRSAPVSLMYEVPSAAHRTYHFKSAVIEKLALASNLGDTLGHPIIHYLNGQGMALTMEFNNRAGPHVPRDWMYYESWKEEYFENENAIVTKDSYWSYITQFRMPRLFYAPDYGSHSLLDYTIVGSGVELDLAQSEHLDLIIAPEMIRTDPPIVFQGTVTWTGEGLSVYRVEGSALVPLERNSTISWGQRLRFKGNDNAKASEPVTVSFATATPSQNAYDKSFQIRFLETDAPVENVTIPINESSGAKYRKIALNGAPLSDEKPQQAEESDQAREETFIDALTLGLRHDTTDAYMAVPASDLFLGVRRSVTTDIWRERRGVRPTERPDRPFGTGWTSNLAASIQFTKVIGAGADAIQNPDTATVTDENGAQYTFAMLYGEDTTYDEATGYSGPVTFVPIPTSRHEQNIHEISLVEKEGKYLFKRKFGSTLTYEMSGLVLTLPSDRISGGSSGERNNWARLTTVVDRYGNTLKYDYGNSVYTLIPKEITTKRADGLYDKLSILQNNKGLVTKIWDAKGYVIEYNYAPIAVEDKSPEDAVHELLSVKAADGSVTTYSYELTEEVRDVPRSVDLHDDEPRFHFNLASITDPLNRTYTFSYDFDITKMDYTSTPDLGGDLDGRNYYVKAGLPRYVTNIELPGDDISYFSHENSSVSLVRDEDTDKWEFKGARKTRVTDAAGNDRIYNFSDAEVEAMESFASAYYKDTSVEPPRMIYYKAMTVSSFDGSSGSGSPLGSETFTFTPEAGMAVKTARDFSGNETHYTYGEVYANTVFVDAGMSAHFYGHNSDPTSQTNALDQTKHFTYGPHRIMTSSTDEAGVKTQWTVDDLGRRTKEQVFPANAPEGTPPIQHTVFTYGDTTFPNFMTKKTVKKLATATDDPTWVSDLVTLYVPDASGRVSQEVVDMNDNGTIEPAIDLVTAHTYDANGNKLTTTDPRGNVTTFSYDKRNRLTHVTYADDHQKKFFYDARGNKTREIDENGVSSFWVYDSLNRVKHQVLDLNGNGVIDYLPDLKTPDRTKDIVTSYTYDALNAKATMTGPKLTETAPGVFRESVTKFEYDALQRLVKKIDDYGTTSGHLNYVTTYKYDVTKNPGGSVFNSSGFKPTQVTDPRSYRTKVTYDDLYRPVDEEVEYKTNVFALTHKDYDAVGNLTQVTAPAATGQSTGTVTKTIYDDLRRPTSVIEAFGIAALETTTTTDYTSTGLAWRSISEITRTPTVTKRTTTTEYDAAGRPVKVHAPAVADALNAGASTTPITETRYDPSGNVSYVINPLLKRTDYAYDTRNRRYEEKLPAVTDATTGETNVRPIRTTAYDGVGNVIAVQDARGFITTTDYDNARRPWKVTAPPMTKLDGTTVHPTTTSTYDQAGNVLTMTDANGHVTTNSYDALNRLQTTLQKPDTDPTRDILVQNEYDPASNRTAVIDGKNQRTEFTYDGLNRNLTIKDPANRSVTFTYDALNKTARVDSKSQRTEYAYDARHRLTGVTYVEPGDTAPYTPDRTYGYDLASQLLSVTEPGKSGKADVAYTYDALGRQTSESSGSQLPAHSAQLITHTYAYDLANNRVKITYGGTGTVLLSTYDAHNRLKTLTENSRVTTYGYDLNGNRVLQQLPNSEEVDTQFDPLGRAIASTTSKATGSLLLQLTQTYDPVGNLVKLTERHFGSTLLPRTVTNTYDSVNRLTGEVNVEGSTKTIATTYGFDRANNRTAKAVATTTGGATAVVETAYVYNNLNQLETATQGATVTRFTYDHNGNRATRSVQTAEPGIYPVDTYTSDYENRLVGLTKNTTGGTGTYAYVYDYRTRRVERTENATTTKLVFSGGVSVSEYQGGTTSVSSLTAEYIRGSDWGGGVGGLLYSVRSGAPSFKHYNSRGDVISATDATGAATWQGTYEAYGTRTQEVGTTADRQKANTKEEDPTGLLNEGFRYRCLETGVFITRDPLGFVDGPNMYAYVVQNPWSKFDPDGLQGTPARMPAATPVRDPMAMYQQARANLVAIRQQQNPNQRASRAAERDYIRSARAAGLDPFSPGNCSGGPNAQISAPGSTPTPIFYTPQSNLRVPNPNGRNGSPEHQADVANNNNGFNPPLQPGPVGNRVPDGVGQAGQAGNVRGVNVAPGSPSARVITESEAVNQNGQINSQGRAQIRDVRAADPAATIVVTDHTRPSAPPMVYYPGSQPPPSGRLPSGTSTHVPAPKEPAAPPPPQAPPQQTPPSS